jgi:RimJ/RimL family protein N-acetyltransferase
LPTVKQYTSSTVELALDIAPMIARSQSGEAAAPIYFAICREPDAHLVATVGFHTLSAINRTAEITYDVDPAYWAGALPAPVAHLR